MILGAVILGYMLGVAPFLWQEYKDKNIFKKSDSDKNKEDMNETQKIINEWLNGEQETEQTEQQKEIQYDVYEEYVTGNECFARKEVN